MNYVKKKDCDMRMRNKATTVKDILTNLRRRMSTVRNAKESIGLPNDLCFLEYLGIDYHCSLGLFNFYGLFIFKLSFLNYF